MTRPDAAAAGARTAQILICSTRAAAGAYEDLSAPILDAWLRGRGFAVSTRIVADGEPVRRALTGMLAAAPSVLFTSGGTGLSPDDLTPEMTAGFLDRELPGICEAIRAAGTAKTPLASLSRGLAGTAGRTFIVNLPGSPNGVRDGLAVLDPVLDHICDQLEGSHVH